MHRRRFLGQASCLALGSSTLFSTLNSLKFINSASMASSATVAGGDYKAMICIMLSGGADSHNMLIPRESGLHQVYTTTRSSVAIPRDQILPLNSSNYGVHPSMPGTASLFNRNKLSFISNIGTLIQPMVKDQVWSNDQDLPLGLFSHSDQIQQWQTSLPSERSSIGWGGRIADLLSDMNDNDKLSMNISLSGSNIFQSGNNTVEYSLDAHSGAMQIYGYREEEVPGAFEAARNKAVDNILDMHYQDMFKKTYIDVIKNSRDVNIQLTEALENAPYLDDLFAGDDFSSALKMVCRTISARESLGMQRQIFFVDFNGWDHHDELLNTQAGMLSILDRGLQGLNQALERIGIWDCVSCFTCSEFGRTLTWNGNGTDHAWGGNVMVMGGPVNGGRIFGEYPLLELGSEYELSGSGIILPTLSVDQYFAELAIWFGVSTSDLLDLFPNLGNFYSVNSGTKPIGFMQ